METINKGKHRLVLENGRNVDLYVVSDYSMSTKQTVIVNESATGNGGVSYSNGRTHEEIPINGRLIGRDTNDLNNICTEIQRACDSGEVVDFIGPFNSSLRSNKFFISEFNRSVLPGVDDQMTFSLTLSEYRSANTQTTSVNKVQNFQADLLKQIYSEQTGNV